METVDIDTATLRAIIELQLEDIDSTTNETHENGEANDFELALKTQRSELESLLQFEDDRRVCNDIARVNMTRDSDTISTQGSTEPQGRSEGSDDVEENARDDDELSMLGSTCTGNVTSGHRPQSLKDANETDNDAVDQENPDHKCNIKAGAESSSLAVSLEGPQPDEQDIESRECIGCMQALPIDQVLDCSCSHSYCQACVVELFHLALFDETYFPPRCCSQPVPIESVREFLPSELTTRFHEKEIEFNTKNRTYCHVSTCSTFIPPNGNILGDEATCPECNSKTCVTCKAMFHEGEDCPEDTATQELIRMADEEGWQRCFSCRRLVELSTGCNHITCPCKAQFCYHCGVEWKNCDCPQFHEHRLIDRAIAIVDREAAREAVRIAPVERERRVQEEMENQRQNHACARHDWDYQHGESSCDECHQQLPVFILVCRRCRIEACRRCAYNRL